MVRADGRSHSLVAVGATVKTPMRVVSPYRPFPPESKCHRLMHTFDWVAALQMLRVSVTHTNACETVAITDVDTDLPTPSLQYQTTERRLMLWILDVALCYLRSDDFDRDTILLSPDLLVFGDLRRWMTEHFTILMRTGYPKHPILNAVQFWPVRKKAAIAGFYEQALAIGRTLPDNYIRWGGDTEPLRQLLEPLSPGVVTRQGQQLRLLEADDIMHGFLGAMGRGLGTGKVVPPARAILDFRYTRKRQMKVYFDATFGRMVAA